MEKINEQVYSGKFLNKKWRDESYKILKYYQTAIAKIRKDLQILKFSIGKYTINKVKSQLTNQEKYLQFYHRQLENLLTKNYLQSNKKIMDDPREKLERD